MAVFNIRFRNTDITERKYQWLSLQAGRSSHLLVCYVFRGCSFCYILFVCNLINLASRFLHFIWSLKFSTLSALIIESFTFDILSGTISCTDFVRFSLISFNWSWITLNLLSTLHLISLTEDSKPASSLVFLALHPPSVSCGCHH